MKLKPRVSLALNPGLMAVTPTGVKSTFLIRVHLWQKTPLVDSTCPRATDGQTPTCKRCWCWVNAASMKLANNGCGAGGFDLNSGWYCTARNHG